MVALSAGAVWPLPVVAQTPPPPPVNGPAEPPEEAEPARPVPEASARMAVRQAPTSAPEAVDPEAVDAAAPLASGVPVRPPLARYQPMMDKMPFGEASAELRPTETALFAKNLYLAGIGGDERIYVSTKDKTGQFMLTPEKAHDGIELVKVNWSDQFGGTTVTVRKAGEVAVLEFDQAAIAASPSAPTPKPNAPSNNSARPANNNNRNATSGRTPPQRPTRLIRTRRINASP